MILGATMILGVSTACEKKAFREPQRLGGRRIAAKTLNRGRDVYLKNCEACHGRRGDGRGPAAPGTVPPPRDFTLGFFKYLSVADSGLPTDGDLLRTTRRGIPGTRMPPWAGLAEKDLVAAIHYLKTFSPRWKKLAQGQPIPGAPDPWAAALPLAEARGDLVMHGAAQCWTCHPAYRERAGILDAIRVTTPGGETGKTAIPMRANLHLADRVETRYGWLRPPDFLSDALRAGEEPEDLYRTVAAGIGGTPMPTWSGRLPPRDLWAVVRQVERLLRLQGTPEAEAIRRRVREGNHRPRVEPAARP